MKKYYPEIAVWPAGELVMVESEKGDYVLASDCEKAIEKAYVSGVHDGLDGKFRDPYDDEHLEGKIYARRVMEDGE